MSAIYTGLSTVKLHGDKVNVQYYFNECISDCYITSIIVYVFC